MECPFRATGVSCYFAAGAIDSITKACAKNGSPLVVLRDDGTIFMPIDNKTPAASVNPKLMPFAGQRVSIQGEDYVRNGAHALVIESIAPAAK